MDNHLFQLIIKNFSVGTWLQTLLFYTTLFLIADVIFIQLKASSSKRYIHNEDDSSII